MKQVYSCFKTPGFPWCFVFLRTYFKSYINSATSWESLGDGIAIKKYTITKIVTNEVMIKAISDPHLYHIIPVYRTCKHGTNTLESRKSTNSRRGISLIGNIANPCFRYFFCSSCTNTIQKKQTKIYEQEWELTEVENLLREFLRSFDGSKISYEKKDDNDKSKITFLFWVEGNKVMCNR